MHFLSILKRTNLYRSTTNCEPDGVENGGMPILLKTRPRAASCLSLHVPEAGDARAPIQTGHVSEAYRACIIVQNEPKLIECAPRAQ